MQTFKHALQKLTPVEISIINQQTPCDEPLSIQLDRGFSQTEDTLVCTITATVLRESELNAEKKSFLIRYALEAVYDCDDTEHPAEELQDIITKEMYAYIRLGITSVIGAAGIDSIALPASL